jgi:hypothetical protein
MRLDHVSYAATSAHLADTVQRLGAAVGTGFVDGGMHPRFGTRNFVLPLADDTYLEVVAALDHPATDRTPFGQAVKMRAELGGGWMGWVVAVDDIAPVESRLQRPAVDGNRHRPDGFDLRWKQIGVNDTMADPQLPFFVQWLVPIEEHPSHATNGTSTQARITRMDIAGDPQRVSEWLGSPVDHLLDDIEVTWVDDEEPGLVAVHVAGPHGTVVLD